ncbi:DUF6221 family protein [Streptomyces badius]|uniref:Uncharacterized protein n=1 Tax=Streptomyces badius TaxID=1941 RepID=A0ABQ2TCL4_STRBA|nr:DUF6221 family protein [Streptomyces badius]GGS63602.1 hypothetical protein GCM10010253_43170 [Streptomyces badius]
MTDALVAFLKARLDDDERTARACAGDGTWTGEGLEFYAPDLSGDVRAHAARHDPARTLREVEAKRRILRAHAKWCEGRCEAKYPEGGFDAAHYWSIKALATVYADHPDYQQEWRP